MKLIPDRFLVTAIVREVDDDGTVLGEKHSEPYVFYNTAALEQFARDFEGKLAEVEP